MEEANNLTLWEKYQEVPKEYLKEIKAGRLKGMTDINPQWRLKMLTQEYGVCGIGWYYEIVEKWIDDGANGERVANVVINLYIKNGNEWSRPIVGIGGSKFISNESKGAFTSDEAYKMATTDAISVVCKQLGFGSIIYEGRNEDKYATYTYYRTPTEIAAKKREILSGSESPELITEKQRKYLFVLAQGHEEALKTIINSLGYENTSTIRKVDFNTILNRLKEEA